MCLLLASQVAYAYIRHDIFIWLANEPGLLLGIFFTFTAYGLTTDERANTPSTSLDLDECHEGSTGLRHWLMMTETAPGCKQSTDCLQARNGILALLVVFAALLTTLGFVTASGALDDHTIQLLWWAMALDGH